MKTIKYSRQRESIKTYLLNRCDHPTADVIYTHIREDFPNISLGTVYRNLNLLVDLGEICKITCTDGADHFDADISPHYHFVCRDCGAVKDVPMEASKSLDAAAQKYMDAKIDGHTIYFYGSCKDCSEKNLHECIDKQDKVC